MGDTEILLEEGSGTSHDASDGEAKVTAGGSDSSHTNAWPDEGAQQISEEIEVHPVHIGDETGS